MTEKYHFDQLDCETIDYLVLARTSEGQGMPGVYAPKSNSLPVIGLIVGFVVIIATVLITLPPLDHPVREAMLQTAGLVLGGWMVLAAFRVWSSRRSKRYAGHFIYADPEYLYEGSGSKIAVTDLIDVREAKATRNYEGEKYKNTEILLNLGKERMSVVVADEVEGQRLTRFLNAVAYMRDGGEDGRDQELRDLNPVDMGLVAKEVALTGEFPRTLAGGATEVNQIPKPKKERFGSLGLLPIVAIVVVSSLLFLALKAANKGFRDDALFERAKGLPPTEQVPAMRIYLANPDFTAHRAEAQDIINRAYDSAVANRVKGNHAEATKAFGDVLATLKSQPQPVVSLTVSEEGAPAGMVANVPDRELKVRNRLADKWSYKVGDGLVAFASPALPDKPTVPDKTVPAMVFVRYKFDLFNAITYTVEFRKLTGDDPFYSYQATMPAPPGRSDILAVENMINAIVADTVGQMGERPIVVGGDF